MKEFDNIVSDILNDKEFQELDKIKHHKGSRLEHSVQVAKESYNFAKKHNLDYVACARAGLLHDFFEDYKNTKGINRLKMICFHGKIAAKNSERFYLTDKEKNIIESHMFPISGVTPKSKEAVLVSLVDKTSALNEFFTNFRYQHALYLVAMFLMCKKSI